MKKMLALILTLAMVLSLGACGSKSGENTASPAAPANPSTPGDQTSEVAWPEKTVTVVVPFSAGGTTDLVMRKAAEILTELWGQNVVVENLPGGGSLNGINEALARGNDGYNIICNSAALVLTQYTSDTFIPMSDYTPLCMVEDNYTTVTINSALPYETMDEFFAAVRENPGEFTMAMSGTKGIWYALAEELCEAAGGLEFTYIPYDGSGDVVTAVASGTVDCCMAEIASSKSLVDAGELRVLAYLGDERCELIPDVPTGRELGLDLTSRNWFGVVMANGTDQAILDKISDGIKAAMEDSRMTDFLTQSFPGTYNGYMNQSDYTKYLNDLDSLFKSTFAE